MNKDWKQHPHIFEKGLLNLCKHCRMVFSAPIHNSQASGIEAPEIEEIKRTHAHIHECVLCGRKHYCEVINCSKPKNFACECQNAGLILEAVIRAGEGEIKCIGHTCVTCGKTWHHDYKCNKPANMEAQCSDCFAQASVDIHRPEEIEQIKINGNFHALSGREQVEEFLKHEQTVYNMTHDASGNLLDNWLEINETHIIQLRALQEKIRIHEQASEKSKRANFKEQDSKLSPEEIAQMQRDAKKVRTPKEIVADKAKIADDQKKAYNEGLKNCVKMFIAQGMNKDSALKRAKKMFIDPASRGENKDA